MIKARINAFQGGRVDYPSVLDKGLLAYLLAEVSRPCWRGCPLRQVIYLFWTTIETERAARFGYGYYYTFLLPLPRDKFLAGCQK